MIGALFASGYMFELIGITHLVVGALLLANRFVPLALVLFAPFVVNSIAFHLFPERSGLPMAGAFLAGELTSPGCIGGPFAAAHGAGDLSCACAPAAGADRSRITVRVAPVLRG